MLFPSRTARRLFALLVLALAPAAAAQLVPAEITTATYREWRQKPLAWERRGVRHTVPASLYANDGRDRARRPYTVALADDGPGPIAAHEAQDVAGAVSDSLGVPVGQLALLFRYDLGEGRGVLTIRCTLSEREDGRLGSPSWRVLTREEVEDYTNRQLW